MHQERPQAEELVDALCAAVARARPEEALSTALALVADFGIRPGDHDAGELLLTLGHGSQTLSVVVARGASLDARTRSRVSDLLSIAFARSSEHEELRRTHERMELLSSASFEGLFFHIDGVIIDANLRVSELLGLDPDEVRGDRTLQACVAPEDLPGVLERIASGYQGSYVITGVRKDGTRFRAEIQAKQGALGKRPVRVVAVRDVTERELTRGLLEESERRLRSLAETAFDVTTFSRDGVVLEVVGDAMRLLGYEPTQMVGKPVTAFVAKAALPAISSAINEGRIGVFESIALAASGEEVPLEVVAINTVLRGQPVRMSAMRDMREAKRKERERRELELMFERSQRLESLGVLAGGIAHDFNNLLTPIIGNAELLSARATGEDRKLAHAIVEAAVRAAGLTAQMLAYAGRAQLGPCTAIDLRELVAELRTLLDATLSKRARISVSMADHSIVFGARATLTQLLMNLLINASDALADRSGTIEIRTQHVVDPDRDPRFTWATAGKLRSGPFLLLEVADDGVGMDAATKARIFEPFFTTKSKGHGLGLAATLGIVSAHGGALWVDSEPGRGSTFSVLLPAYQGPPSAAPSLPTVEDTDGGCVLVVDDEPLVRSNVRAALEAQGYRVLEAESGTAALDLLQRERPSVVLLDMTMPGLSGLETLQRMRESGSTVPVVLSSGYHDGALEVLPDDHQSFLQKPYTIAELLRVLRRAK